MLTPEPLGGIRPLATGYDRATEAARIVVDQAMPSAGGGSHCACSVSVRLQWEVLAGIHQSDAQSVHSTVATTLLGRL